MFRETTIYTEWLEQRYNEGRVAGEVNGKRLLLQKQFERKFGLLTQDLKERLQKFNSDQLDALATDLFDLATIEDLRIWLARSAALLAVINHSAKIENGIFRDS